MVFAFLEHIKIVKRYSAHTILAYETDLKQASDYLEASFSIGLDEANPRQLRSWLVSLVKSGLEPRSLARKVACLKSFYKFFVLEGRLESSPATALKTPRIAKRSPQFVEKAALDIALAQPESQDYIAWRDYIVIEVLYGLGLRLSELLRLTTTDFQSGHRVVSVTGKGNKQRLIPIHGHLQEAIARYLQIRKGDFPESGEHFILADRGEKAYPMLIQRIVRSQLSKVTSLKKKSPHVLRHSFATHLLNEGAELNAIKEMLGHSSLQATEVYTHNHFQKIKEAYSKAHPRSGLQD
jgi:integrase/recombinase XerC